MLLNSLNYSQFVIEFICMYDKQIYSFLLRQSSISFLPSRVSTDFASTKTSVLRILQWSMRRTENDEIYPGPFSGLISPSLHSATLDNSIALIQR
jgi:hypothetical protein